MVPSDFVCGHFQRLSSPSIWIKSTTLFFPFSRSGTSSCNVYHESEPNKAIQHQSLMKPLPPKNQQNLILIEKTNPLPPSNTKQSEPRNSFTHRSGHDFIPAQLRSLWPAENTSLCQGHPPAQALAGTRNGFKCDLKN